MRLFTQIETLAIFLILVAGIGAGYIRGYFYVQFVTYVKAQHPEVWTALGKPGMPEGPLAHRRLLPWLVSGRYKEINDEQVNRLAFRWRMTQVFQLFVVVGAVAAITRAVGVW